VGNSQRNRESPDGDRKASPDGDRALAEAPLKRQRTGLPASSAVVGSPPDAAATNCTCSHGTRISNVEAEIAAAAEMLLHEQAVIASRVETLGSRVERIIDRARGHAAIRQKMFDETMSLIATGLAATFGLTEAEWEALAAPYRIQVTPVAVDDEAMTSHNTGHGGEDLGPLAELAAGAARQIADAITAMGDRAAAGFTAWADDESTANILMGDTLFVLAMRTTEAVKRHLCRR
jgi:hypothetical protein